ncbi:MAG TPA: hypothetical protein VM822_00980, partial [Pseudolabrys sp.]|nr:hypothetical protein [Pseudolabrys sp.]
CRFSERRWQLTNANTSPNKLNTTLMPHSITHGDACFAYFNKIRGILEHQMTERISGYDPETDVCWQFRKQGRQGRVPDPPPPTGTKTGVGLAGPL